MTMSRKEQIRNKARELGHTYFPDSANIWARSNVEAVYVENACVEMAEWLDQHPQWIPVEEELPTKRKDPLVISDKVFIRTTGGHYLSAVYDYQDKQWIDVYNIETLESNEVTHWMPIVPPRKEE